MKKIQMHELKEFLINSKVNALKVMDFNLVKNECRHSSLIKKINVSDIITNCGSLENFITKGLMDMFETIPETLVFALFAKNGNSYKRKGFVEVDVKVKKEINKETCMVYLFIEKQTPTTFYTIKEAKKYRKNFKKKKAMFCLFKEKDFKEGFANCVFKKI